MKYVALLRGINVGGNSVIKMADLKTAVEKLGYGNVMTYIQSGNVIFESEKKDISGIALTLENGLSGAFGIDMRVVVVPHERLRRILHDIPQEWNGNTDIRKYLAFVKPPVSALDVAGEFTPKEGVDSLKTGNGVLYITTLLSGLTKSGFSKIATKKIYRDITIRNHNTMGKLLDLMDGS